eukprot:gene2623-biopygen1432
MWGASQEMTLLRERGKHLQVRESPEEVRKKSGMTPGSGGLRNGTKSGRVPKSPGKVRNGPGPLSDDRSDPRLRPMTKRESKAKANTQGRPEKVRNRGPESPEESGKVLESPEKSGKVRKSPEWDRRWISNDACR